MRVQYNPKQFLRQIPKGLLKEFFDRREELTDLSWDKLSEMDVNPVFNAWMELPEASRADVERSFRSVSDLATPEGLQTLIEEGQFHRVDLAASLNPLKGLHEKALWVYLNHQRIFVAANRLNRADHLNGRYWRRRTDLPAKQPDLSHPTRKLLEDEISRYYREHQGRGEHCKVEVYLRREKIHYFFVYPADYADTVIVYNDAGALERQLQKAAFDVIFAYNAGSGTLDLFIQGDKNLRREVEEIFARLVLKEELPALSGSQPFELNGLRSRDFDFPTNPDDGIRQVHIKSLRLSLVGPSFGRITLESDARAKRGDIYDLMDKALNHHELNSERASVTQATMQVMFATSDRPKTITFQISCPDSCNLKDKPEHLKIKEYLKRWGIARE